MVQHELGKFESEFLCPRCGGLLYIDVAGDRKNICINRNCKLWPYNFRSIINVNEEKVPGLYKEIQDKEKLLIREIHEWKAGKLALYAYQARRELISTLFTKGIMPLLEHFIAIGELLLLINNNSSEGEIDDIKQFTILLNQVLRWNRDQRNLEDVSDGRIVLINTDSGSKALLMKYTTVFIEFQEGIGLLNKNHPPRKEALFPYTHLEALVTPELDMTHMTDGKEILQVFWLMSLQLRYWLQEHHRTKKQYDYTPDILDFTVLFGWWLKTWGIPQQYIPLDKEENEKAYLQKHFDNQSHVKYSADHFFKTYIDSTELVPVVVRTSDGFKMDYHTLLFFLIYLQGCPDSVNPALKSRGQLLTDMRTKVGDKFEEWLREEVRKRGYFVPDTAIRDKFDYDILAISEEKKFIILADAKYRDMAPSSYTSINLLPQELFGPHGLQYEAEREQLRLEYFNANIKRFEKFLNPKRPWQDYKIRAFLVTKQTPLASKYRDVKILYVNEFLESAI